jgi:hypothetical protein
MSDDEQSVLGEEAAPPTKKSRTTKVTNIQKSLYLDFCEANPKFVAGRLEGSYTKHSLENDWKTITLLLNEAGPPTKKFPEWRGVSNIKSLIGK